MNNIFPGLCCQLYVKSASAGTTFNVTVTDAYDVDIRKITGIKNVLNDLTKLPVRGVLTIAIDTASADEAFTLRLIVEEF